MPLDITFAVCATRQDVVNAVNILRESPYVVIDCEGKELGMEDGALSLICVGTAFAQFIFLFDVLALTRYDLQPLLSFLGSKVMKVVWDGRMDFIELWSTFNVSIGKNVCDLQVAEVLSRSSFRGERDDERLSRLVTYFGPQVWNDPLQFAGIHRVVGLQKCLEENGYRGLVGKDPEVTMMHRQNGSKVWLTRPLPWNLLRYAAADIYLIALLYEDFSAKSWLPLGSKFFGRCNRYVTMHEQFGRIGKGTGCFRSGPFIPFGILNGGEPKNCWKTTCNTCGRNMSLFAFETDGQGSRRRVCRLCWLLAEKFSVSCDSRWVQISISL